MVNRFTRKAQNSLNRALSCARELGHTYIGSEHLLLGLLAEPDSIACRLLSGRGIRYERTRSLLCAGTGQGEPTAVTAADMTPRAKKIIEKSASTSGRAGHGFIGTEHLLYSLSEEEDCEAVKLLTAQGVCAMDIRGDISAYFGGGDTSTPVGRPSRDAQKETMKDCPHLTAHSRDLCGRAKAGLLDPVIGREEETERLIRILSRRTKNNPCLIGEPGVGKTAVVEGLANRIAEDNVPEPLLGRTVLMLDIASMIAGAKYRGEFEERMKGVIAEAAKNSRIILFIDEIHTIIGAGSAEGAMDAANILKPALARGEIQIIGATTAEEYRRHIERDAALARRFQSVPVGEPTEEEAITILRGLRDRYEAHHRLRISEEAMEAAVKWSARYIPDQFLPDKAIDLIDEAAAKKRLAACVPRSEERAIADTLRSVTAEKEEAILAEDYENAASLRDREKRLRTEYDHRRETIAPLHPRDSILHAEDIADIVTARTGIPVNTLEEAESKRLTELEKRLTKRVIGQENAVAAVARAIRRGRAGLKHPRRPVGSFLFLGPTGVGKTELARALADTMYGGEAFMIRLDMSEYMEKHTVSRMIGSPPGYVGYDDGGQLTEKVRRRPYSVILFDEVEKAHPDVFHLLLQILEDGTLTDARGRRVDFANTVIIMTSNVGAPRPGQSGHLGFASSVDGVSNIRQSEALREFFRPEFLNRIDEILTFTPLKDEDIQKIASAMLAEITARAAEIGITLHFPEETIAQLSRKGYDPRFGARPLRRVLVRQVEDTLSEALLIGHIQKGDSVTAVWDDGVRWEKT